MTYNTLRTNKCRDKEKPLPLTYMHETLLYWVTIHINKSIKEKCIFFNNVFLASSSKRQNSPDMAGSEREREGTKLAKDSGPVGHH